MAAARRGSAKCLDPYELLHLGSGRYVVDESRYCYQLTVAGTTNSGLSRRTACVPGSAHRRLVSRTAMTGTTPRSCCSRPSRDFGPDGPTSVRLEHRITLSSAGRVVERSSRFLHHRGRDRLSLGGLRSSGSARPCSTGPRSPGGRGPAPSTLVPGTAEERHLGQGTDHHLAGYAATDLFPDEWTGRLQPAAGS